MRNITYSTTTQEAIKHLTDTVNAANDAIKAERWTDADLFGSNLPELRDKANAAIIKDACTALIETFTTDGGAAFVEAYFSDWFTPAYKVSKPVEQDDLYELTADGEQRILWSQIDRLAKRKIMSNGAWLSYLQIYVDNVARAKSKNATGETAVFTKTTLPQDLLERRNESDKFWKGCGSSDLCKQLDTLIRMMMPADFQPTFHMLSADQNTVADSLFKDKDIDKMDGAHKSYVKTKTAEKLILRQINVRMNNLAIDFETGFKDKTKNQNTPKKDEAKSTGLTKGNSETKPVPTETKSETADTTAA